MGGLERNTYTLADLLSSSGFNVTVLTETESTTPDDYSFTVVRTKSSLHYIKYLSKGDLLIVNGGLAMKVVLSNFLLGKPYILIYQTATNFTGGSEKASAIIKKVRNFFVRKASCCAGVSYYATKKLEAYNKRTATLVNPIDQYLDKENAPASKKYDLLFAGRLIDGKGIYLLVDSIQLAEESLGQKIKLAFAGDGESDKLIAYGKERNVDVIYLGRLDKAQLVQAYKSANLLVVPSTTHIEGNPLVLAEAMSLGTAAIVSDQPAMVEAIGDAGMSFKSGDKDSLAKAILAVISDEKKLQQLTENTAHRKEYFSYERYKDNVHSLIKAYAK